MRNVEKIEELITDIISELEYEIVRVQLLGQEEPTLQIMIERADRTPINVEDCAKASRAISDILDENIDYLYFLEVSSAGADRPLTKPEHFKRFEGFEAKLETKEPVMLRKRFKGDIINTDDKSFYILVDGEEYGIAFDNVEKAKLVINDKLMNAYKKGLV